MNIPKFRYRLQLFFLGLSRDIKTLWGIFNFKKNQNKPPQKILISGLVLLGDLVLISPLFQALKQEFPEASIELLVPEGWKIFAQYFKAIDQVFEHQKNNPKWLNLFKKNHKNRWQLGVIPWSYASINLFYALGITQIRSFPDPKNRKPYRIHQKINLPQQADYFSLMTLALSSHSSPTQKSYPAPHFDLEKIQKNKLPSSLSDLISSSYILIHPGASSPTKYWGAKNYAQIAHYLISLGYQVILTGTLPEQRLTQEISDQISQTITQPTINLAGKTKLHELLALISGAQLVLGPDTGVLHLTRALHIPSITLMGPTQALIYGPHPQFHDLKITKSLSVTQNQNQNQDQPLSCQNMDTLFKNKIPGVSNCRRSQCLYKNNFCMTDLSEKKVITFINQILKR